MTTFNLTPVMAGLAPVMIDLAHSENTEARDEARKEILRWAKCADAIPDLVEALRLMVTHYAPSNCGLDAGPEWRHAAEVLKKY